MSEQRLLITPWGNGTGPVPGAPSYGERVLTDYIVKVWPFQNVLMGLIKRKTKEFQLRHEWPLFTLNARNSTATPWAMNISEIAPETNEPFLLNNTWTCLRFAVVLTHIAAQAKRNWTADLMQEWIEQGMFKMMRGWEFLIPTSSYVAATAPNVIPQMAGLGYNTTGTAFDASSGPVWNSLITDTNSRQSQRNAGGAAWSLTHLETGMRVIRQAGGEPTVCIVGNTNKGIAESFPHPMQQFPSSPTEMKAHRNVDTVRTRYGIIDIHMAILSDYPQQAVTTLDTDSLTFVVPEGMGLQKLDIEPLGDHDQAMFKSMGSLENSYPHGQDLLVNTTA